MLAMLLLLLVLILLFILVLILLLLEDSLLVKRDKRLAEPVLSTGVLTPALTPVPVLALAPISDSLRRVVRKEQR